MGQRDRGSEAADGQRRNDSATGRLWKADQLQTAWQPIIEAHRQSERSGNDGRRLPEGGRLMTWILVTFATACAYAAALATIFTVLWQATVGHWSPFDGLRSALDRFEAWAESKTA